MLKVIQHVSEESGTRINASARSNNNKVNCAALLRGVGGGNFNNAGGRSEELTLREFEDIVLRNVEDFMKENQNMAKKVKKNGGVAQSAQKASGEIV